jgi:phosphatidylglycerol:prolipoprotein diacylglycerol transferase
MHPALFGGLVSTYGLCLATGFLLAVWVASRASDDPPATRELALVVLLCGILGARLAFVAVCGSWARALYVWEGGLVFYGGLAGGALGAWMWAHRRKQAPWAVADALVAPVALGHAFGRLGCFFAGCCFGREAAFGARFPPESLAFQELVARGQLSPAATATAPLHPVQLYEALVELALFVALSALARRKRWHGQVVTAYLLLYGLSRAALEGLRGDGLRGTIGPLSTSQAVAALTIAGALLVWRGRARAFSRA